MGTGDQGTVIVSTADRSSVDQGVVVLAVAASVSAEADPQLLYNLPLAYHHAPLVYHHPLVYTAPVGCQNNDGALVPCAHGVLPALAPLAAPVEAAAEAADEADAEADPEADPWLYYHGLGYAAHPYGY